MYTLCPKKAATWCLIITLANVDRFSKFVHQLIREMEVFVYVHKEFYRESAGKRILKIGPHLPKLLSNIKWLPLLGTRSSLESNVGLMRSCGIFTLHSKKKRKGSGTKVLHQTAKPIHTIFHFYCHVQKSSIGVNVTKHNAYHAAVYWIMQQKRNQCQTMQWPARI